MSDEYFQNSYNIVLEYGISFAFICWISILKKDHGKIAEIIDIIEFTINTLMNEKHYFIVGNIIKNLHDIIPMNVNSKNKLSKQLKKLELLRHEYGIRH